MHVPNGKAATLHEDVNKQYLDYIIVTNASSFTPLSLSRARHTNVGVKWSKKRSTAQSDALRRLHSTRSAIIPSEDGSSGPTDGVTTASRPPPSLSLPSLCRDPLAKEKTRADDLQKDLRNQRKKTKRAVDKIAVLKDSLTEARRTNQLQSTEIHALTLDTERLEEKTTSTISAIRHKLNNAQDRLHKHVKRTKTRVERVVNDAVSRAKTTDATFRLKEKGVVSATVRDLGRDLTSFGVPSEKIDSVIKAVGETMGKKVVGSISRRTVGRAVAEGGIFAKIQVADAMKNAESITTSGDGTTHKHINYESRHINTISNDGKHKRYFMGVHSSSGHTSEMQLEGWKEVNKDVADAYNSILPAILDTDLADFRAFARKWTGSNSDHAADQKKLSRLQYEYKMACEHEHLGELALKKMNPSEIALYASRASVEVITAAGGPTTWESLSQEEKDIRYQSGLRDQLILIGKGVFVKLPDEERKRRELYLWTGCGMHKNLNADKGGDTAMQEYWAKKGFPGPIKLMNRDNAAAAALGDSAARTRAEEISKGGATKTTSLAGLLFNNKDDKKGHHDGLKYFFMQVLGYTVDFPDTSNTRYQSHAEAATELLVHLPFYLAFLERARDAKESQAFNHMELNVYTALQDIPTLTELAAFSLYSQAVSHPYLKQIRGSDLNALDMGPLHHKVITFCESVIADPNLVLSGDAEYSWKNGTLDGKKWDRPEAYYAVQHLSPRLPHLKDLTSAFFTGATTTWKRFAEEFAIGGKIDTATPKERQLAWMPTTNDLNEGMLGAYRVMARNLPNITQATFNARKMYKLNGTRTYVDENATPAMRREVMKRAREEDESGITKRRKLEIVEHTNQAIATKKAKAALTKAKVVEKNAVLDKVSPFSRGSELHTSDTLKKLSNNELDLQLDWHRRAGDKDVPKKSKVTTKEKKVAALLEAIERDREKTSRLPVSGGEQMVTGDNDCRGRKTEEIGPRNDRAEWDELSENDSDAADLE